MKRFIKRLFNDFKQKARPAHETTDLKHLLK